MAAVLASLLLVVGWAWLAWGVTRPGATFQAEALSVTDGDTIWVRAWPNRVLVVRLEGVDCPESRQAGGPEARRFTAERVLDRTLEIRSHGLDRYGRTLGRVFVAGVDLSLALVQAGHAWHSKEYSSEAALASAETQARVQRIGLWREASPMPPWEFRRLARQPRATSLPPEPTAPSDAASAPPESPDAPGPLHGNTRSMVFHRPGCRNYDCKNCTAVFKDAAEAAAAGYQQAGCCRP
jgi:endonuclease YncB( thermonuclease family)